ncbi:MAG: orotate phosphoribosyltransferase [Anaerolineae bacterium]
MSEAIAQALIEIDAIGFTPNAPITFKSGIVAPVYVDNRRLPYHPAQWRVVIAGFEALITQRVPSFDVIAGVAVGGIPHSSALAYAMQRPSVFVRKEAKGHGRGQRIEGGAVNSQRVVLVEDLVTTGGSSLSGVDALREAGAIVTDLVAIVSYGFDEAQQNFAHAKVNLHTLTNFETILHVARSMKRITGAQEAVIMDWFQEPYGWGSRHTTQ